MDATTTTTMERVYADLVAGTLVAATHSSAAAFCAHYGVAAAPQQPRLHPCSCVVTVEHRFENGSTLTHTFVADTRVMARLRECNPLLRIGGVAFGGVYAVRWNALVKRVDDHWMSVMEATNQHLVAPLWLEDALISSDGWPWHE